MRFASKLLLLPALMLWINCLVKVDAQTLFPVEMEAQWGYVDSSGRFAIKPKYLTAKPFREGVAWVKDEKSWQLIDAHGKRIERLEFDDVEPHRDGRARVYKDNKVGLVNTEGVVVLKPTYVTIRDFHEGFAVVEGDNGMFGAINQRGALVVGLLFTALSDFKDGLAAYYVSQKRGQRDPQWGFIRPTGNDAFDLDLEEVKPFQQGLAFVRQGDRWGVIDRLGRWVATPQFEHSYYGFHEGLADVRIDGKEGFIDTTGTLLIAPQFASVGYFSDGFAWARQGTRYGFIDREGKWLIEPMYEAVTGFQEGFAAVKLNGKWGFVDRFGRERISPQYTDFELFKGEMAKVRTETGWQLIGPYGGEFSPAGLAAVERKGDIVVALHQDGYRLYDTYAEPLDTTLFSDISYHADYLIASTQVPHYEIPDPALRKILGSGTIQRIETNDSREIELFVDEEEAYKLIYSDSTGFKSNQKSNHDSSQNMQIQVAKSESRYDNQLATYASFFGNRATNEETKHNLNGAAQTDVNASKSRIYADDRMGIVNAEDDTVLAPVYEWVQTLGDHGFITREHGRWQLRNAEGKAVLPSSYDMISPVGDKYVEVGVRTATYEGDTVTFSSIYNTDGEVVAQRVLAWQRFENGLAALKTPDGWMLKDTTWQTVELLNNRYPIRRFGTRTPQQVVVETLGGTGVYDLKSQAWRVQPAFEDIELSTDHSLFFAAENGRWGVFSADSQWVVKPAFDVMGELKDSLFTAKYNGKWGLVGLDGTVRLDFEYDAIQAETYGYRLVNYEVGRLTGELGQEENAGLQLPRYGYASLTGELLLPPTYRKLWPTKTGFLMESEPRVDRRVYYLYNGQQLYPPNEK